MRAIYFYGDEIANGRNVIRDYDVIIIGGGAAGLMCAIHAGRRGRRVLVLDHAKKIGEKIRISGGGRCNFTNLYTTPKNYISDNMHFCKSALSRFTQHDFMQMLAAHNIAFHEKKLGQLFCDESARQIIDMLLSECDAARVEIKKDIEVQCVASVNSGYDVVFGGVSYHTSALVIATGGLSIPKIGASKFGYDIARQFGLQVTDLYPALVPLTFQNELLEMCKSLAGLSVEASVSCGKVTFAEGFLFTHRGISGPSILQISSYWQDGQEIVINLAPHANVAEYLKAQKNSANSKLDVQNLVAEILPKRLAASLCDLTGMRGRLAEVSDKNIDKLGAAINAWCVRPSGSEGYRTAEVTLGGVSTADLSSQTMESLKHKGLYFIGEVVDVTGHLGGFNFQWAWSSGYACGQAV